MGNLDGKTVLLTGGCGFLGLHITEALAANGAEVIGVDNKLDQNKIDNLIGRLKAAGLKEPEFIESDIAKKRELEGISEKHPNINVLINNAACKPDGFFEPFESYRKEVWDKVMEVNLTATMLCCQVFGSAMARKKAGSILNIASIYGVVSPDQRIYPGTGFSSPAVYSASKGGVIMLTKYLACYWGKSNVRVNSISPGGVFNNHDEKFVKNYSARVPLGRMAKPEEIADTVVFLASDKSGYINGQNIIVDGGLSVW